MTDSTPTTREGVGHTPTPWHAEQFGGSQWAVRHGADRHFRFVCLTSQGNDQANAKFIVKACNAHDDLVAAVKRLLAEDCDVDTCPHDDPATCPYANARAVLKKVEASHA